LSCGTPNLIEDFAVEADDLNHSPHAANFTTEKKMGSGAAANFPRLTPSSNWDAKEPVPN
jgi:hypothetical protein